MKFKHSAIAIAIFAATPVLASSVQELQTTSVKAEQETQVEVTSEQLERKQVNDVKGAINNIAGVSVSNTARYSQKVYVRGLEEHAANITIDGVRQDGMFFHHATNQVIDTSMLKSVSVELGATSVLSGYGANTGAIRYETKDPSDLLAKDQDFGAKLGLSGDTATEFKQVNFAGYGRLTEQFSLLGMFTKNDTGDIETPKNTIISKHSELESAVVKAVYDIDSNQQVVVNLQSVEDGGNRTFRAEAAGLTSAQLAQAQAEVRNGYERDTYSIVYKNNSDDPLLDLYINAYHNEKSMVRAAQNSRTEEPSEGLIFVDIFPKRDYIIETTGLDIRNQSIINNIAWTYGIESFKTEQSVKANGTATIQDISMETGEVTFEQISEPKVSKGPGARLMAAYAQAEFTFGDFTLIPGLRYDNYELTGIYNASFSKVSPKLSAAWQANRDLSITTGYGKIFSGPGLPELLFASGRKQATPNAQAQQGNHYELNINYDLASVTGLDKAEFYTNLYQYNIDRQLNPGRDLGLAADSDYENQGIEAGASFTHQDFRGYINFSANKGERIYPTFKSDDSTTGSKEVNLGLSYQATPELLVGWDNVLVSSEKYTVRFQDEGNLLSENVNKPGYGFANIWLSYEPQAIAGVTVNLAVDNLFDKAYRHYASFSSGDLEAGRNIKASVNYQF